jgi:hypothetical protein
MRPFRRIILLGIVLLAACPADPAKAGRKALEQGNHLEAVKQLRQAYQQARDNEDLAELYGQALEAYLENLRRPNVDQALCNEAWAGLPAPDPVGTDGVDALETTEIQLLSQALLCRARHHARQNGKAGATAAADVVIQGIEKLPAFAPGSPVLTKALLEPAQERARAGEVTATTALAQVIWSSGNHGEAAALLDVLQRHGANDSEIFQTLADRATKGSHTAAPQILAADFGTWHGHAKEAAAWYQGLLASHQKKTGPSATTIRAYVAPRAEEAETLAQTNAPACKVKQRYTVAQNITAVTAMDLQATPQGALLAWVEGEQRPNQQLKAAPVSPTGQVGTTVVIASSLPAAAQPPAGDVHAAYAPKNREVSMALARCGNTIEVAARGAPRGAWSRATLSDAGQVSQALAPIPPLSQTARLPTEDVWWNIACVHDQLVHLWLADTQLMRLAWFRGGEVQGEPANLRLPGFAPSFVATAGADQATRVIWVDIMGETQSGVLQVTIPASREIPMDEETNNAAVQPLVDSITGRVEHLRLTPVGERWALTYVARGGDLSVRWLDDNGRPLGSPSPLVRLRSNARNVRFDAAGTTNQFVTAWSEAQTDRWGVLYMQSFDGQGQPTSRPQRVAALVRPDLSPVAALNGNTVTLAWADRSLPGQEAVNVALLRCPSSPGATESP